VSEQPTRVKIEDLDDEAEVEGFAFDLGLSAPKLSPTIGAISKPVPSFNPQLLLGNSNWAGSNCTAGVRG